MKKILGPALITFLTILVLWSCKKSFLDATSQDGSINDASAFKSKKDFDAAVIGIYASLQ